jgi:hypothetical protein
MKQFKNSLFLIFIALFVFSCDTDTVAPRDANLGKDFFVLSIGHFVSYNVKETQYAFNQPSRTVTYQLREVVENEFINEAGKQSYRLVRYTRANGRQNWQIADVWTARLEPNGAVRTEENTSFLKLIFPFEEEKTWDGNAYNDLGRETYRMNDLGKRFRFDNKNYDQTVTIVQSRDSNLVNKDFRTEIYAKGIGLIYRKSDRVAYCQDRNRDCIGKAIIESGLIVEQSIFDTGVLK